MNTVIPEQEEWDIVGPAATVKCCSLLHLINFKGRFQEMNLVELIHSSRPQVYGHFHLHPFLLNRGKGMKRYKLSHAKGCKTMEDNKVSNVVANLNTYVTEIRDFVLPVPKPVACTGFQHPTCSCHGQGNEAR